MLYFEKESFRSMRIPVIIEIQFTISIVPSLDITHFEKESFTKRVNDQIIIEMQFIYLSTYISPVI